MDNPADRQPITGDARQNLEEAIDVPPNPNADEVAAGTVSANDVDLNDEVAFQAAKRKLILEKIQQDIKTQKSYEVNT